MLALCHDCSDNIFSVAVRRAPIAENIDFLFAY